MPTDLLARIRRELDERLAQLRPLLGEYERLIAAADTLAAMAAEPALPDEPALPEEPPAEEAPAAAEPTPETSSSAPPRRRGRPPRGSATGAIGLAMSLRTSPLIQQTAPASAAAKTYRPPPAPSTAEAIGPAAAPPSAVGLLERPTPPPGAAGAGEHAASAPPSEEGLPRREPVSPAVAQQAILAALEHGSHTPGELVMVTALSATEVRGSLSRLTRRGAIAKVKRDGDGKAAYALPSVSTRA